MLSFLRGLLGSFDSLDLLEEESPDDSALDASSTENSSVGPGDSLVFFGKALVVVGSQLSDAVDALAALTAVVGRTRAVSSLLDVLDDDSGSRGAYLSDLVGGSVVAKSAAIGNSLHHVWSRILYKPSILE
jgi:hypothetical protein